MGLRLDSWRSILKVFNAAAEPNNHGRIGLEDIKTKKVRVSLSALTRVEYSEVLEVPADMTHHELGALVDQRYDQVDGGLYGDDNEFWERGSCMATVIESSCEAEKVVKRDGDGTYSLTDLQSSSAP